MTTRPALLTLATVAAFCAVLVFVFRGTPSTATPTHAAAVFFDGVMHGDFRQTCGVWLAGRKAMGKCEAYLSFLVASQGQGDYKVVPHSVKLNPNGEQATVRASNAGTPLTVHLMKRDGRWLVWYIA